MIPSSLRKSMSIKFQNPTPQPAGLYWKLQSGVRSDMIKSLTKKIECNFSQILNPTCSQSSTSSPLNCSSQLCGFSDVHYGHFIDWIFANKLVVKVQGGRLFYERKCYFYTFMIDAAAFQETSVVVVSYYTYCRLCGLELM